MKTHKKREQSKKFANEMAEKKKLSTLSAKSKADKILVSAMEDVSELLAIPVKGGFRISHKGIIIGATTSVKRIELIYGESRHAKNFKVDVLLENPLPILEYS